MLHEKLLQLSDEKIKELLEQEHAHDIAVAISKLKPEEQNRIFRLLELDLVAQIVSYLDSDDAADILTSYETHEQKQLVEHMSPDDAADIILELDKEEKEELLAILDKDEELLDLLTYEENQAGAYMTNLFVSVSLADDVKQATKKLIKMAPEVESIQTIFVVNENNEYVGQIPLKKLIKAKAPLRVSDIYQVEPTFLDTDSIDKLLMHLKHYGGYETGIVNSKNELIGLITMDDILDIYHEEATEDYEKLSALPDTDVNQSFQKAALKRIPWLFGLLLLTIPIAMVTHQYEEILGAVVVLALFQPLILDAGGDVSTQTLAVTLIGLNDKNTKLFKNGIKEFISGFISGAVMGILAFIATMIYATLINNADPLRLSMVIGISLWATVFMGPFIGFFVPITLKKLKFDPAVASGPFITTLIDVLSLVVYFTLATLLLGGIL